MLPGLEILRGLLSSHKPLLALQVPLPRVVRGQESTVWMSSSAHPTFCSPPWALASTSCQWRAIGWWALIQSSTAALMLLPASGSKSLLARIQWLHQIITLCLGKLGQHVGGSISLQLCASWTSAQSPERRCGLHAYAGRAQTLPEKKKTDLVNLATIIQEVRGRAANKIQTFCLSGLCLHNNSILPPGICACCLIGTRCSACILKGNECWESHALIL